MPKSILCTSTPLFFMALRICADTGRVHPVSATCFSSTLSCIFPQARISFALWKEELFADPAQSAIDDR